ncbi:TIGR03088 family PEP-CTERM/XrtA system glycosyltransferase [Parahaliea mediterranea]|uniref:TIGR03088 family PEP-CTERM/XrtA system glycosyltransferase n=1 Tax=Parahaliea mediterranea TaxID=651086 RepID=A0A939IMX2_9GAMM|nr:TIGR03088 family PEP-CTERM/XrtA system glycosyltransferase [Parahaliea mediterranea]
MSESRAPLVAHLIYQLGTGGLENGLVNIINRSPADRYRHAIICLTTSEPFARRITAPGVEVIELRKRPGTDLAAYRRLRRELARLSPAIVHSRNLAALEAQLATLWLPGLRRVHGEHGRDMFDLEGRNPRYRWLRRALRSVIHRYVAVSEDLAGWLERDIRVPRQRIRQIYNGVDRERFYPGTPPPALLPPGFMPREGGILLGAVGRLAQVKNHAGLIRALARLFEGAPPLRERVRLVLVGDGPLAGELQQLVAELGLDGQVLLAGERDDIPDLLRAMDLFLQPSLGEGVSNTVLEAMATALPVIATRVGGNPELVTEGATGYLVPVDDDAALAAALARALESPSLPEMGRRARERVLGEFVWERTVDGYLSLYDEVLAPARAGGAGSPASSRAGRAR